MSKTSVKEFVEVGGGWIIELKIKIQGGVMVVFLNCTSTPRLDLQDVVFNRWLRGLLVENTRSQISSSWTLELVSDSRSPTRCRFALFRFYPSGFYFWSRCKCCRVERSAHKRLEGRLSDLVFSVPQDLEDVDSDIEDGDDDGHDEL